MKTKISVNIIVFAITLLFSTAIVTTVFNNNTFSFFNKENKFKTKVKVYNFLLADKARSKNCSDRFGEQVSKLRKITSEFTLELSPDEKNLYRNESGQIAKTCLDERLNADTSELPQDFRDAWSKYAIATKINFDLYRSGANSKTTIESKEKRSEEIINSLEEFKRVVKKYGFELGYDIILVDKEY